MASWERCRCGQSFNGAGALAAHAKVCAWIVAVSNSMRRHPSQAGRSRA